MERATKSIIHKWKRGDKGGMSVSADIVVALSEALDILKADTVPHLSSSSQDWFQSCWLPYVYMICLAFSLYSGFLLLIYS